MWDLGDFLVRMAKHLFPLFEVLRLSIWSLVAKETNAPNRYCATPIMRVFFFFALQFCLFFLLSAVDIQLLY